MARTDPQINIRIPEELKVKLEERAKSNKRSLTAEVVARLEESLLVEPSAQSSQEGYEGFKQSVIQDYKLTITPDSDLTPLERYLKEDLIRTKALRAELINKYFPNQPSISSESEIVEEYKSQQQSEKK